MTLKSMERNVANIFGFLKTKKKIRKLKTKIKQRKSDVGIARKVATGGRVSMGEMTRLHKVQGQISERQKKKKKIKYS